MSLAQRGLLGACWTGKQAFMSTICFTVYMWCRHVIHLSAEQLLGLSPGQAPGPPSPCDWSTMDNLWLFRCCWIKLLSQVSTQFPAKIWQSQGASHAPKQVWSPQVTFQNGTWRVAELAGKMWKKRIDYYCSSTKFVPMLHSNSEHLLANCCNKFCGNVSRLTFLAPPSMTQEGSRLASKKTRDPSASTMLSPFKWWWSRVPVPTGGSHALQMKSRPRISNIPGWLSP